MSLNKVLCKYFDDEEKGYVTIGDIVLSVILTVVIISAVGGVLYSIYQGLLYISEGDYSNTNVGFFPVLGLAIIVFGIFIVLVWLWSYLSEIKIAKCPLKEKEADIK